MRLGLDLGTNSIGWFLYEQELNEDKLEITSCFDAGVRIFSDGRHPQKGVSLAKARREARGARRNRDRRIKRREALLGVLRENGMMPLDSNEGKNLAKKDPFVLRKKALDEKLSLHEIGRILFHINQRRGFQSNRKVDSKDKESNKINSGAKRLEEAMVDSNAKTYGEFLANIRQEHVNEKGQPLASAKVPTVRTRLEDDSDFDETRKNKPGQGYRYYPTRELFLAEFNAIWEKQQEFYPEVLTDSLQKKISDEIIFYQRPLKEQKVGLCLFEDEERLAKSHPLFQELRLYQTLNSLRICQIGVADTSITLEQREILLEKLFSKKSIVFSTLKTALKLKANQKFNLDRGARAKLEGNEIYATFSDKKFFGDQWVQMDTQEQWKIIEKLQDADNPIELVTELVEYYGVTEEQAEKIAAVKLPIGHGRIGLTATQKILEELKKDIIPYSKAVENAGYHHSDMRTGEIIDNLPYYGELLNKHVIPGSSDHNLHDPIKKAPQYWGKIANPTVHIALGQVRHLVNDIIDVYGRPDEIVVEVGRELKNSKKKKDEINKTIKQNTKSAENRAVELEKESQANSRDNQYKMRLWEALNKDNSLDRACPYCGENISINNLFNDDCEIDHILPYSRTLDDSIANKVICHKRCNQQKRNQTPFEAWGHTDRWELILSQVEKLPNGAKWRFAENAMERFDKDKSFESRQLTDTQYLSRITREYLSHLYPEKGEGSSHVWVIPGILTAKLRHRWGLNNLFSKNSEDQHKKKNREDHRHHAIDAAIVAATDRSLLNRIQRKSALNEENGADIFEGIEPPFAHFRKGVIETINKITVSHRADHGTVVAGDSNQTAGELHYDTAYGLPKNPQDQGKVFTRKPFADLPEEKIKLIRDDELRNQLNYLIGQEKQYRDGNSISNSDFKQILLDFSKKAGPYNGIKRVRISQNLKVIPIKDKNGNVYKGYKGNSNHCVEVWQLPDGTYKSLVLTTFDAHKYGLGGTKVKKYTAEEAKNYGLDINKCKLHPAAKLVMRLFKGDAVTVEGHTESENNNKIYTIAKFDKSIYLYQNNEANVDARNRDKKNEFKYLQISLGSIMKYQLSKVALDRLGRVSIKSSKSS